MKYCIAIIVVFATSSFASPHHDILNILAKRADHMVEAKLVAKSAKHISKNIQNVIYTFEIIKNHTHMSHKQIEENSISVESIENIENNYFAVDPIIGKQYLLLLNSNSSNYTFTDYVFSILPANKNLHYIALPRIP